MNKRKIFINCSNHLSVNWQEAQKKEALKYGEIIDVPFPDVNCDLNDTELNGLVQSVVDKMLEFKPEVVMCMGEYVSCYKIVQKLKDKNIKVLATKSARVSNEIKNKDGSINKKSCFDFKGFREY